MSDYTPTTEEVRDAFAIRKWDNFQRNYPNSHDKTERDGERKRFDRWHQAELRRAKTISAEQVEAAARVMHEMQMDTPWGESPLERATDMEVQHAAFRAAGLLIEGEG